MNNNESYIDSIKKLEEFWRNKFPNRARGGRVAIVGFRYQVYVYVLELVKKWLSLNREERSNIKIFLDYMENISDILSIKENGLIIATQVKVTLRTSSLHDALDEFTLVHEIVINYCPELIPYIRYQIICSKSEVKDVKDSISKWTSKHYLQYSHITSELIKVLEVKIEAIPEYALLAILTNDLRCSRPLDMIRKWTGLVIDASASEDTLSWVGKDIWNDLHSILQNNSTSSNSIYLWHENDIPPKDVAVGSILTGQPVNVRHLRDGYFSNRPEVYGKIELELAKWIDKNNNNFNSKIPIFWIGVRQFGAEYITQ